MNVRAKTFLNNLLRRTDHARWRVPDSLNPAWDSRTAAIAQFVPAGTRVIEFGAGRRQLETHLDASCAYFPSDIIMREPGMLVCDLNVRPLPDLGRLELDVAVFSGVLVYVADLPAIAKWLSGCVSLCVASYACATTRTHSVSRFRESLARTREGWINTFSQKEVEQIFRQAGFYCCHTTDWQHQTIFLFRKVNEIDRPLT